VAFCRKKGSGVLYNVGETKESAGFVQTKVAFCKKKLGKKKESEQTKESVGFVKTKVAFCRKKESRGLKESGVLLKERK
jgi:hypothetical protein